MNRSMVTEWLSAAGRFPLLTASQELDLAHKVQRGMADDATTAEKRSGARAKKKMIQSNLRLVMNIAKKYQITCKTSAALSLEDLLQEGCIGLNRAVEKFDPTAGYKLSTYAFWWISQAITRCIEVQRTVIRVPSQVSQLTGRVRRAPETVQSRADLHEWLGCSDAQMTAVERALAIRRTTSLDQLCQEGEGSTLHELIADDQNSNSLDQLDWDLAAEAIEQALPPDDERTEWFKRQHLQGETLKAMAETSDLCREGLRKQLIEFKEEMKEELHPLRDLLAA